MLRIRVVQAEFGDCFILEYGTATRPRYILLDGGPGGIYKNHLRGELKRIAQAGHRLQAAIVSHVDNDHIIGLLEYLAELSENRLAGQPDFLPVNELWFNSFDQTIGAGTPFFERFEVAFSSDFPALSFMPAAGDFVFGIREGNKLNIASQELGIQMNAAFGGKAILADAAPAPLKIPGLNLWVVGPGQKNLIRLRKQWQDWLEKVEKVAPFADPIVADKIDRSIPNLSSIMLLAVSGRRKILLTGDGLGDDVISGLQQARLLDGNGKLHVSILKLPHHGSARNVRRSFFDTVTANTYIISANGKYNNPDLATLVWLVESARAQRRKIKIVATNPTEATVQLRQEYPPGQYGYKMVFLPNGESSMVL